MVVGGRRSEEKKTKMNPAHLDMMKFDRMGIDYFPGPEFLRPVDDMNTKEGVRLRYLKKFHYSFKIPYGLMSWRFDRDEAPCTLSVFFQLQKRHEIKIKITKYKGEVFGRIENGEWGEHSPLKGTFKLKGDFKTEVLRFVNESGEDKIKFLLDSTPPSDKKFNINEKLEVLRNKLRDERDCAQAEKRIFKIKRDRFTDEEMILMMMIMFSGSD
jgi:hypothetical protein